MKQNYLKGKDPWDVYLSPYNIQRLGAFVTDKTRRAIWCQAFLDGGNTLRLWNMATELKASLLATCAPHEGQDIMLVGRYCEESGFAQALRSITGEQGSLRIEEIGEKALDSFFRVRSTPGTPLSWDFDYFYSLPDAKLDRIILYNAMTFTGNLDACASQIRRVLKRDGRVIIAESPIGGKELLAAAHNDTHFKGMMDLLLAGLGWKESNLPGIGLKELEEAFRTILGWTRSFAWRGLYLFYGQKDTEGISQGLEFPTNTAEVQKFLTAKPESSPWDFITEADIAGTDLEIGNIEMRKKWGRVFSFGGGLTLHYVNNPSIPFIMYSHLKASPGYRALVIGERLEGLGFLPELRKRIGDTGEITAFDIAPQHRETYRILYEQGPDADIAERHQWDYPFADKYPDNYFDLVWLPQGVHHAIDWKNIAPRLVRVLKPNGQLLMSECRLCHPEYFNAIESSGLLFCIADKGRWAEHVSFEELPDYSTAELSEAFGDSLTDKFSLEADGWLLFWGYKK